MAAIQGRLLLLPIVPSLVIIPVIFEGGTQSGLMRSHSLGRHEYNGERFGSRQTIQIQTRDKSAYGRIGKCFYFILDIWGVSEGGDIGL